MRKTIPANKQIPIMSAADLRSLRLRVDVPRVALAEELGVTDRTIYSLEKRLPQQVLTYVNLILLLKERERQQQEKEPPHDQAA